MKGYDNMPLKEKIARITDILFSLSETRARKKPYDLSAIAESLIARYDPFKPKKMKELPIYKSVYGRRNAWTSLYYWDKKLKESGKFVAVLDIIKK